MTDSEDNIVWIKQINSQYENKGTANKYEMRKRMRKQPLRNLLGHNGEVAALPEGAERWLTGLDSILLQEEQSRGYEMEEHI